VVFALPSKAAPLLLGASSDGQYFAYADHKFGYGSETLALHWYNQQTGNDVIVGAVTGTDTGRISADGHHIVFTEWGSDPLGKGLLPQTVYEATIDDTGNVTYTQISSAEGADSGLPSVNADGTIVAYATSASPGGDYVWSSATDESLQIPGLSDTPMVLSSDGTTVVATSGPGDTEYSTTTGEPIRTLTGGSNVENLSANGDYGVGFTGGKAGEAGDAYFNFLTGVTHVIPNTEEGSCGPSNSALAVSADGQNVAFGSLSSALVPDPSGGSLGYFSYDPTTEEVVNQSGTFAGIPPREDCPSVAITGDGQTMFFVGYNEPSEAIGWISGTVTNNEDKPLAGVVVVVFKTGSSERPNSPVTSAVTSSTGKYTVELASGSYKVEFVEGSTEHNYAPQYYNAKPSWAEADPVTVTAKTNTTSVNAAMQPGGQVSGTVTNNEGKPLYGVRVAVFEADNSNTEPPSATLTSSTGSYTISNLASGSYKVEFSANTEIGNYATQYYNAKLPSEADLVQVTAGSSTPEINAEMQPGGQISGTVTNHEGKPLTGVSVSVFEVDGSSTAPVGVIQQTDSNGHYTVSDLASGSYKVKFSVDQHAGNYAPQYYNTKSSLAEADPVAVTAGSTTPEINTEMQPGGQISGMVTNNEGKALEGVDVNVFEASGSNTAPVGYIQTDSNGNYTISDLASGSYKVEFSASFFSVGNYATQYYNDKVSLAEADPVTVTAGSTTPGISAEIQPGATAALAQSAPSTAVTDGIHTGTLGKRELAQASVSSTEGHAYIYKSTFSSTPSVPPAPVNSAAPSISGEALEGLTLTESHGSWTNQPTAYSYQWQDCDSAGSNCSAIAGATSQTYTLSTNDVGHTIRVQESASNAAGTGGPVASVPTTVVTAPAAGGGSTGAAGGGSTGTGGGLTGAGGLTGGGSTLGTAVGGMLSNAFTLGGSQPGPNGSLLVTADVPGPGTLTAQQAAGGRQASIAAKRHKRKGRAQPKLIQPASVTATKAGAVTLTLRPTTAALKLLRGHHSVKVSVQIMFTPTDGTPSNHTIQVTFKAPKGKHGH
jgi:5-hydroxyisourate hydrolase-like protein (transthyretin family)